MLDGGFWAKHFRRVFSKQIAHFCTAIEKRFLPTFDSLEAEAERASLEEWERLGQFFDPDYSDEAEMVGRAYEAGAEHYMSMEAVRQSLINLAVAALYHLFEQQLLLFHRRQVLNPAEEDNKSLISTSKLKDRLSVAGIDLEAIPIWKKVEELKVVANTIKHAEGTSADKLRQLRPDLFNPTQLLDKPILGPFSMLRVYMPLAGEDIFLTADDLKDYREALLEFWEQFGAVIQ